MSTRSDDRRSTAKPAPAVEELLLPSNDRPIPCSDPATAHRLKTLRNAGKITVTKDGWVRFRHRFHSGGYEGCCLYLNHHPRPGEAAHSDGKSKGHRCIGELRRSMLMKV
jgi:hypothetical protein